MACIMALTLANSGLPVFGQGFLYTPAAQAGFFGDLGDAFEAAQDAQRREQGHRVAVLGVFLEEELGIIVHLIR